VFNVTDPSSKTCPGFKYVNEIVTGPVDDMLKSLKFNVAELMLFAETIASGDKSNPNVTTDD